MKSNAVVTSLGTAHPGRVAVIFINYGPYHVARARALMRTEGIDPIFIELASAEKKYTWESDKRSLGDRLITLAARPFEDCRPDELSRMLVDTLKDLRPRAIVIAGYGDPPMRAAARWARAAGARVVVMSETTEEDCARPWWREQLKRLWFRRYVDAAFVGGQRTRNYVVKLGLPQARIRERYDVVDNAYFASRCERFRSGLERADNGLPPLYFLYVGRFAPEKNLRLLLRAYARYRQIDPGGWGLVLVGDGPQREELRRAAASEGLSDVVWPGYKQFHELPQYYAGAGCFILPSVMEPWGLVVNEAMACGLPVIASSRCGCAADLVQEGRNGFQFEPTAGEQLERLMLSMAALSAEKREAMGRASKEIISGWTPEVWASQLASALQAAANASARSDGPGR